MFSFIAALVASAVAPIRTLTAEIVGRLSALWAVTVGFAARVRDRLTGWVATARAWLDAQRRHALAVLTTLRWLAVVYVPSRLESLARSIETWTSTLIDDVAARVRDALTALREWFTARLAELRGALIAIRDWILARVAELRRDVTRLLNRVFGVLATPERAAAWLVGAMAGALWRYALDQAVPVGRALWASRTKVALESANVIEDIIVRII